MKVYLGNKKINRVYSGDKETIVPTTEASINIFPAEYLLIAAGGTGASSGGFTGRGGGGAGGLLSGSMNFTYGTTYNAIIDTGGGNSTFRGLTASAGGRGGNTDSLTGLSGGSGGGYAGGISLVGGAGTPGQGNAGGGCSASNSAGGGGGGAGGAGGFGSGNSGGGGTGLQSAISGVLTYYAGGGGGGRSPFALPRDFGENGPGGGDTSYGGGSQASQSGAKPAGRGVLIIRYYGPQKATGGTITTDGDYTIHTFNWPNNSNVTQPFSVFPKGS
jgi:hypothetical protein